MYQNKLLCFKTCYCLGVSDATLQTDFPELHEIAQSTGYYDSLVVAKKYRAITRIFYTVVRYADLYEPMKSFNAVAGDRFKSFLEGTGLNPDLIYKESSDLPEFINRLVEMSHRMLPNLYDELKLGLDFTSFETIMRLKCLSADEIESIRFALRRTSIQYSVYFFESPILNIAVRDMLRTDSSLRKFISMAIHRPLDRGVDTSNLALELNKRDDGYFVSMQEVMQDYKNVYMITSDLSPEIQSEIVSCSGSNNIPLNVAGDINLFIEAWKIKESLHSSTVILARINEEELSRLQENCPGVVVVLLIPVNRTLYRNVLSGLIENTYMLSMR